MKTRRFPIDRKDPSVRTLLSAALATACLALGATAGAQQPRFDLWQSLKKLDTNGDGVIDQNELAAARQAAFKQADADHDGYVSGKELDALQQSMRMGGRRGFGRRERFTQGRQGRQDGAQGRADHLLKRLDKNGDGRISEAEFLDSSNPLLARFDANGDGKITREEVEQRQAQMRQRFQERGGFGR